MRVLVIGGGGREHALCWALRKSETASDLFCAPGNAGIADIAVCVPDLEGGDAGAVAGFCEAGGVELVVVGPEAPLAAGLADGLRFAGVSVVGPGKEAARLESSKAFMREICAERNIPSPRHACFAEREAAKAHLAAEYAADAAVVVKADGLAAGKGVVMAANRQEAYAAVDDMLDGRFGAASSRVLVEECLQGREASFFFLCDGETALPLGEARDYKRVGEGDVGANTGGMGAYAPLPDLGPDVEDGVREQVASEIVAPALQAMAERGCPFTGFLYAGVMIDKEGAKLLEFNVRLGDPEAQVVLPRLRGDFLELLAASCSGPGALAGRTAEWDARSCLTVVLAARGYPGAYETGEEIVGVSDACAEEAVELFHAGTKRGEDGALLSNGGRVLAVSALGEDLAAARRICYEAVGQIRWPGGVHRRDIGLAPNEFIHPSTKEENHNV